MRTTVFLVILGSAVSLYGLQTAIVGSVADVTTATTQGSVLMGGGSDVDAAFRWMIEKSGGGDFVVIRWGSLGSYNNYPGLFMNKSGSTEKPRDP